MSKQERDFDRVLEGLYLENATHIKKIESALNSPLKGMFAVSMFISTAAFVSYMLGASIGAFDTPQHEIQHLLNQYAQQNNSSIDSVKIGSVIKDIISGDFKPGAFVALAGVGAAFPVCATLQAASVKALSVLDGLLSKYSEQYRASKLDGLEKLYDVVKDERLLFQHGRDTKHFEKGTAIPNANSVLRSVIEKNESDRTLYDSLKMGI
ncbi:hypothetical protein ACK32R_04480 [Aeromonas dhakensis]|jgi:hypothetical protein|uniref:hypothetical protein n=1 Tax=Aeromonas dhakensis TaxID=196024 RepID=UPI003985F95D